MAPTPGQSGEAGTAARQRRLTGIVLWIAALGPSAAAVLYVYAASSPGGFQAIYYTSKFVLFALPALFWVAIERRARSTRRLRSRSSDLMIGLGSGLVIGALMVGVYVLGFSRWIDHSAVRQVVDDFGIGGRFLLFAFFISVINSACEEYYWRWFVFGRLRQFVHVVPAALLSSGAFAAHHFIVLQHALDSTLLATVFSMGVAIGGVMWSIHFNRTGRLLGIWLSHFLIDVAAMIAIYDMIVPSP